MIALGAAQGLAYLHHDCSPRIIHRDVKSSNILLDKDFEAHLTDFGIAKSLCASKSHTSTYIMGTIGYIDPEYARTSRLTEKSDVYSYGVVLLELLTGRKAVDNESNLHHLVSFLSIFSIYYFVKYYGNNEKQHAMFWLLFGMNFALMWEVQRNIYFGLMRWILPLCLTLSLRSYPRQPTMLSWKPLILRSRPRVRTLEQ